jgi:MerR family transcriptional regulator, thiopeptide resistance regulator
MPVPRTYRVADVARLAGVSIRALHHYDAIGLLVPTGRTEAGYRLYTDADIVRLQQVLIGRELGFSLDDIKRSLDDPLFDQRQALLEQRQRLTDNANAIEQMLRSIDAALAVVGPDPPGGYMDMKELFSGFDPSVHEAEVEARWSGAALEESKRRVKSYTADDWKRWKTESAIIYGDAAAAMRRGVDPASSEAAAIAERHRLSIDMWFYPCSRAMHAGLADMYEADDRFRTTIDAEGEGLTAFLAAAIRANAGRAG